MSENIGIEGTETTASDKKKQQSDASLFEEQAPESSNEPTEVTQINEAEMENTTPDALRELLLAAEAQVAENLSGWQRAQADYQNYKRRTVRDLEQARATTAASILSGFFPILDDLTLALDAMPEADDDVQWREGVHLVHRKLLSLLESEHITQIKAEPGQNFDPTFHEAVLQEEHSDFKDGEITAVLRPGYQLGERVLRATQVRVAK